MSVIYWNDNSNVQIQAPYVFFYASSSLGILPYVGIWLVLPNTNQPIIWQDHVDVLFSGDVRPQWAVATAGPSIQLLVIERSVARFVFGGVFRRVN